MSTNYYARFTCDKPCRHCSLEERHLGQTAAGWQFAFQAYGEVIDYSSWRKQLDDPCVITDEYSRTLTVAELEIIIANARQNKPRELSGSDFYDEHGNYFSFADFS